MYYPIERCLIEQQEEDIIDDDDDDDEDILQTFDIIHFLLFLTGILPCSLTSGLTS